MALWVSTIDEAAVRNTADVDVLLKRADLPAAKLALEEAGFVYRHEGGLDIFLDGVEGRAREAVHIVFDGEMVKAGEKGPNPQIGAVVTLPTPSGGVAPCRALGLEPLVRVQLTAFRDKDRTHLRDMIELGLVDVF